MYDNTAKLIDSVAAGRPSTEIEGCLSRTNNAVERLHSRVSAIEDRLRPVMRATGSGTAGATGVPKETLSPLGEALRSVEDGVDRACDRLEGLLNGLAL